MSSPTDPQFAATPPSAPAGSPVPPPPAASYGPPMMPPAGVAPVPPQAPYGQQNPYAQAQQYPPPGYPQQPYRYAQEAYGYVQPPGGPEPQKASAKTGAIVAIGLLVLALVAGAVWYVTRSPQPTTTPSPGTMSSPSQQASAPPSMATSKFAPGPGNTASLRAYLERLKLTCVDEKVSGIVSYICLRHKNVETGVEEAMVYVGGLPDGRLGRITLSVLAEDTGVHAELQKYLLEQFLGDPKKVASTLEVFATGTADRYADASAGGLSLLGVPSGSMVLSVDDWVPASLVAPTIGFTRTQLAAALSGYSCETSGATRICKKTSGDLAYTVTLYTSGDALRMVRFWAEGPGSDAAAHAEIARIVGPLDARLAADMAALKDADKDGYSFSGSILIDYYRESGEASGMYIGLPCWTDQHPFC